MVEEISLYENLEAQTDSTVELNQIGADDTSGTKSSMYNQGEGLKGTGVTIGILEASNGRYDNNAPQLKGLASTRLQFVQNPDCDTTSIDEHATMVTSLIVGKKVQVDGVIYEGVVPNATVIQMNIASAMSIYTGIQELADRGVDIINMSAGFEQVNDDMEGYNNIDKEVDRLVYSTGVIFVNSAGNTAGVGAGEVTSPGKALNVITVGNANTKDTETSGEPIPYRIWATSSFVEPDYLPNKPDIVAPGTNIVIPMNSNEEPYGIGPGTSVAAPLVTGVLAQMCQRAPSLKYSRERAKAMLLLGAQRNMISTTDNASAGNYLRDKSGAGLVNAPRAIAALKGGYSEGGPIPSSYSAGSHSFQKGQKIRAVMVFGKSNTNLLQTKTRMENVDLCLINDKTGKKVASSTSTRNNVEIIEYIFTESGQYHFSFELIQRMSQTSIPMSLAWQIVT